MTTHGNNFESNARPLLQGDLGYREAQKPRLCSILCALLRKNMLMAWKRGRYRRHLYGFCIYGGLLWWINSSLMGLFAAKASANALNPTIAPTAYPEANTISPLTPIPDSGSYNGISPTANPAANAVPLAMQKSIYEMLVSYVMSYLAPFMVSASILSTLQQLLAEMVMDKESKMKIVQLINGVPLWLYWMSYLVQFLIIAMPTACGFTAILKQTAFKHSSCLLLWMSLMLGYCQMFATGAALAAFFERARNAATMAGLLNFGNIFAILVGPKMPSMTSFLLGFLPGFPLINLLQAATYLEMPDINPFTDPVSIIPPPGWNFDDFFATKSSPMLGQLPPQANIGGLSSLNNELPSPGTLFLRFILQVLGMAAFAYWIDQVWRSDFGAAKPWYFCCLKEYMFPSRQVRSDYSPDANAVIELRDLTKTFRRHGKDFKAVDGMTLDVKVGELFALLGHNGAGKTTAINCIIGMLPITSGDAYVLGHSARTDINRARWNLSICPQDSPLYEEITVDAHLRFFAILRGSRVPAEEIPEVLDALGLTEKRFAKCQTLSGGQKRRLWVATSLLGRAPVVFLDEPTSGMDPASRRELWDLLVKMKSEGRSIIFTTHYLDEADVLADRKAVLAHGKVVALGNSRDLKMKFGVGYHLNIFVPRALVETKTASISRIVERWVPESRRKEIADAERNQGRDAPEVLSFILPFDSIGFFGKLLCELEQKTDELQIATYELVMTSLEEVFMALGQDEDQQRAEVNGARQPVAADLQDIEVGRVSWDRESVGWLAQVRAVIIIRIRATIGAGCRSLCWEIFFPIAIVYYGFVTYSSSSSSAMLGMLPAICFGIAVSGFTVALVRERNTKAKHVMISQGLPSSAYWTGTFLENYLHSVLISVCIPLFAHMTHQAYMQDSRWLVFVISCILAPLPIILGGYTLSNFYQTEEGVQKTIPTLNMLMGAIPPLIVNIFWQTSKSSGPKSNLSEYATLLHICFSILNPYYCVAGVLVGLWYQTPAELIPYPTALGWLTYWRVSLPLIGAVLQIVLLSLYLVRRDLVASFQFWRAAAAVVTAEPRIERIQRDQDVVAEEERVASADPAGEACLYRNLHHTYYGFRTCVPAVRGVSLGVKRGECFGLLGPNGAGKTTTLACLTGEVRPPTEGEVFVAGHSVTGSGLVEAYKHLGNCPQVDPLWASISGRAHLHFYGRLKGVPKAVLSEEADRLLRRLGFSDEDANKNVETYSGGMKRKLSVAIALIGTSNVLLLDEPSAALDAAAKRQLWQVIKRRSERLTVVVTTHSMEEAEALCDRLAIQVVGQLRCLGTPLHIKQRHGSGYQLEIEMCKSLGDSTPATGSDSRHIEQRQKLMDFVHKELSPNSTLKEDHNGRYLFQLPPMNEVGLTLGKVFCKVQEAQEQLGIESYSMSQPSLEQVFLRFAQEQEAAGP